MLPTDLTVSTVVEKDGRFLIVEERASGVIVLNQPGGHIESGESPEQAAEREALEESGCVVRVTDLLGVYLWIHPQTRQNFLRIAFAADLVEEDAGATLDDGIHAVHWMSPANLERRRRDVRTPAVIRAIEDYQSGNRQSRAVLESMMPVQQNVQEVLAKARLI